MGLTTITSTKKNRSSLLKMLAACGVAILAASFSLQEPAEAEVSQRQRVQRQIDEFVTKHPRDLIGLDTLLAKHGLGRQVVRVGGIEANLTAAQAQPLVGAVNNPASTRSVSPYGVPSNAFNVWVSVYESAWPAGGRTVHGWWNFRDNYVNGSAPDDVAGIETDGGNGCYTIQSGSYRQHVYDYTGTSHDTLVWLSSGGTASNSPWWTVRDSTSGFVMYTDNGDVFVNFNPTSSGCANHTLHAQFDYEHAQDGGGGFSVTIGWGLFSVSYSSAGSTLKKSSGSVAY